MKIKITSLQQKFCFLGPTFKISTLVISFVALTTNAWGQTTIFSDGFNSANNGVSTTNFTGSGSSCSGGYVGMSATTNSTATSCPASAAFASEGASAYHVRCGDITLTSGNIDTRCMNGLTLSFKLAAFSNGTTNGGMDNDDYVLVSISPDGGVNYYPTIRVRGNGNAKWLYSSTGTATEAYDGNATLNSTVISGPGNNDCTTSVLANGPSTVSITNLPNTSNMRIRLRIVSNNTNERWLIDDLKVTRTTINTPSVSYSGSSFSFCVNSAISNLTPTVSGVTSLSISPALPTGLSFNTSTGVISGTPTTVSSGTVYTVTANASGSCSTTTTISIETKAGPTNPNAGADVSVCAGGSTQLIGSATKTEVTLLNEEFNNGFPTTWSRTYDFYTPWLLGPSEFDMVAEGYIAPATTTVGNGYLVANSDWYGGYWLFGSYGTDNSFLRTPTINCSGYDTVIFEMSHYYEYYATPEFARLQVSIAGGTWTTVYTWTGSTSNPDNFSIVVPSAAGQSDVRFRLRYYSDWSGFWVVDDIKVKGRISPISYSWSPSNSLSASNISNPTASPTSTITYTMTATSNGCSASDDVIVTVNNPSISSTPTNGDMVWRGSSNDWTTSGNWWQYNGTSYVAASAAPTTAQNVIIPANQTCVLNQPNIATNTAYAKGLTIENNAELIMSSGTLYVLGNWTNNGIFTPGIGTVNFNGAIAQTMSGTGTNGFYSLTSSNTSTGLTLNTPVLVSNQLTMTSGDIYTTSTSLLTIGSASGAGSVTWTAGTVVGPMRRWFDAVSNVGNASGLFPVGNNPSSVFNRWVKVEYTSAPSVAGYLTAEFIGVNPITAVGSGLPLADGSINLTNLAAEGYWEITPSTVSGGTYMLTSRANNFLSVLNSASSRIVKSPDPHTTWSLDGAHGAITGTSADYTISRSGMTGYSYFTVAYPSSVLPVELVSLTAECAASDVLVKWTTASEHNSMLFAVEHSENGTNWDEIGTLDAAGNSVEMIDYVYVHKSANRVSNYYRIVQVDQDGVSKIYGPVSANCFGEASALTSYPNPSTNDFTVAFNGNEFEGETVISMIDQSGRTVFQKVFNFEKDMSSVYLHDVNLAPGVYQVVLVDQNSKSASFKQSIR